MHRSDRLVADVTIVGAGLAGTALAHVLDRKGLKVTLIDPRETFPQLFKAEKIDHGQVDLFKQLGLFEYLLPHADAIRGVRVGYEGRVVKIVPLRQYGIAYGDMVNALRSQLPATVDFRRGWVNRFVSASDSPRVQLTTGQEIASRLTVIAGGTGPGLKSCLRHRRRMVQRNQCVVFGFDVEPSNGGDFNFDSVTYYALNTSPAPIAYLTLFRLGGAMRANLFAYCAVTDLWVREFIASPQASLRSCLPQCERVTGEFRITGAVRCSSVDLYQTLVGDDPGLVLIGDAYQTACPATGLGLSKILTDVDVLSDCIPRWIASPGMGRDKLAEFYSDPRKVRSDAHALRASIRNRRLVIDRSPRWRVRRALTHLRWKCLGLASEFLLPPPSARHASPSPGARVIVANRIVESARAFDDGHESKIAELVAKE